MKPIRTGIIGFGLSGRVFQAPFLANNSHFNLTKIYSSRESEIHSIYPNVQVVNNYHDIINDPGIDLVVNAAPNTEHYNLTKAALENNKHVIVEKPFVTEIAQGEELIKLSENKNKILSVFQNRRWDGDFKTVKNIINSNILGKISEYEVHFDRFRPENDLNNWRNHDLPGSGVFFDLGPHLIDQALVLFGIPKAVFGDIRIARSDGLVDDTFEITLYYDKTRVKLKAGVIVKETGPHFIIHGNKGSYVKYGLDPQENLLKQGAMPVGDNWGAEDENQFGLVNIIENGIDIKKTIPTEKGNYMGFFDNVYEAVVNNKPLAVTPKEALLNIRIILTAIESSKYQKVITL